MKKHKDFVEYFTCKDIEYAGYINENHSGETYQTVHFKFIKDNEAKITFT